MIRNRGTFATGRTKKEPPSTKKTMQEIKRPVGWGEVMAASAVLKQDQLKGLKTTLFLLGRPNVR